MLWGFTYEEIGLSAFVFALVWVAGKLPDVATFLADRFGGQRDR